MLGRLLRRRPAAPLDAGLVAQLRQAADEGRHHGRYWEGDFARDTATGKALLAQEPEQLTALLRMG